MSVEHKAPSTYILRELHDVTVPDPVSWMPQTIGWKILATIFAIAVVIFAYRLFKQWWHNRYRGEALSAVQSISEEDAQAGRELYHVLSVVQMHLDKSTSAFYGKRFLAALDWQTEGKSVPTFDDALGEKWLESMVNPRVQLSSEEVSELKARAQAWVLEHDNQSQSNSGKAAFWINKGSNA